MEESGHSINNKSFFYKLMLFFSALLILQCSRASQLVFYLPNSPYPIIETKEFGVTGVVFSDTTDTFFRWLPTENVRRITPTVADIQLFEKCFYENFATLRVQQEWHNPNLNITARTYRNFVRQYYGFIDEKNHTHMWVSLTKVESKSDRLAFYKTPRYTTVGHWRINCNISTGELYY